MAVLRDQPPHALAAQPRAQAIDEAVHLFCFIAAANADLLRRASLGDEHRQPRHVEAEARIERVGERGEPLGEQRADLGRIADRPRRAGGDAAHGAIGAEQGELDAPRAVAAPLQRHLEPLRQPLGGEQHVLLARDRLGEALLGDVGRDRQARRQRLVLERECAVELAQDGAAEARGQRCARQVDHVADLLETDARERGDRRRFEPQRRERQRRQQSALLAIGVTARCAVARGGVRRADRAGDGDGAGKPGAREPRGQIGGERLFAAVEMRAAGDVEREAVRRVAGDERRVAQAPVGDVLQELRVGVRILRHDVERGMHRARLRQRQPRMKPEPHRGVVDRGEHVGIAALAVDGERRARILTRPGDAVGGEAAEPQAEHALRT